MEGVRLILKDVTIYPYFRAAVKITQQLGPTPIPTGKEIDGKYLEANYDEASSSLQKFKQDWKNFGVTLMCDSWTGPTGMSIINFMVYCNTRMFFLNTIDASSQTQNSAIDEVSKFRECQGRFGTRLAEEAAARMEPSCSGQKLACGAESEDDDKENEFVDTESADNDGVSEDEEDDPSMQDH